VEKKEIAAGIGGKRDEREQAAMSLESGAAEREAFWRKKVLFLSMPKTSSQSQEKPTTAGIDVIRFDLKKYQVQGPSS